MFTKTWIKFDVNWKCSFIACWSFFLFYLTKDQWLVQFDYDIFHVNFFFWRNTQINQWTKCSQFLITYCCELFNMMYIWQIRKKFWFWENMTNAHIKFKIEILISKLFCVALFFFKIDLLSLTIIMIDLALSQQNFEVYFQKNDI